MKTGLVLEGGGMRGLYTIGVLDLLMEHNLETDYVIGVSAGACNGASYVSKQKGRGYRVDINYLKDKRYVSFSNFIKTKSVFGMDFIFDEIPHKLDMFDYDTFLSSPCQFVAGVTDVETGESVYYDKQDMAYQCTVLRASSAIPMFSPIVEFKGHKYLDGAASDPIPFKKAIEDGCDRLIVVLTRDRNYVKPPESPRMAYRHAFKKYPAMIDVLDRRHLVYNKSREDLKKLEQDGSARIIAPSEPIKISRFENNMDRLHALYALGKRDALAMLPQIKAILEKQA